MSIVVHEARVADIPPVVLYEIIRIRVDVFVVEQNCAYSDLDGLDLASTTRLLWAADDDHILATIRVLNLDKPVRRIGRVATSMEARGRGSASLLMRRGIDICSDGEGIEISAQEYLKQWYGSFGFVIEGEPFLEDDIPHVPMRLTFTQGTSISRRSHPREFPS